MQFSPSGCGEADSQIVPRDDRPLLLIDSRRPSQDVLPIVSRLNAQMPNRPECPIPLGPDARSPILRYLRGAWKFLLVIWVSPYSLLGICIGGLGMLCGGDGRFRDGAFEFYGGTTAWFVRRLPTGPTTAGFTLGHVILGQTGEGLQLVGKHERVHVRQFERWGPLMGPAYLGASAWMWLRGRDAYRDNPFEVEAYRQAP